MSAEPNTVSLKTALESALDGPNQFSEFIHVLIRSKIVVITDKKWNGHSTPVTGMRLLLVSDGENTNQAMLAIFTDDQYASAFLKRHSSTKSPFEHAVVVDAAWAILGTPQNAGIMVNPNSDRPIRLNPDVSGYLKRTAELGVSFASIDQKLRQKAALPANKASSSISQMEQLVSRIETCVASGDLRKAEELQNSLHDIPENAKYLLYVQAILAEAKGNQDSAISILTEATQKADDPVMAGKIWSALARLYEESKQLDKAEDAYVLACSSDPANVRYALDLSRLLIDEYRTDEALTLLKKAVTLHPDDPQPNMHLGNLYMQLAQEDLALHSYEKVAAITPESGSAHFNRAICLQALGRLEESTEAFERALRLDPTLDGYSQYTQIRKFSRENAEEYMPFIELLKQRARSNTPLSTQIDSNFSLAKVYDTLGDLDTSFNYLEIGNKLKRSILDYSSEDSKRDMDEIKKLFSKQFIERFSGKVSTDLAPIFILGMPRSGSTLTEQILAGNSRVNPGSELIYLANMGTEFGNVWKKRTEKINDHEEQVVRDLRLMGEKYIERTARFQLPGKRFTDKMPGNFMHIGLIYLLFPNASVVHCHRHPADTCLSCYERLFTKGLLFSYDLQDLGIYYKHYLDMMQHWRSVLPEGFILDVKYENVVKDAENQIRRLLDFCKLDFEESCLEFHKVQRTVTTASVLQVRKPLYKSSLNRWKKYGKKLNPLLDALGPELVNDSDKL